VGKSVSLSVVVSESVSVSVRPSLGVSATDSVSVLVVGGSDLVSEVGVVVSNTESLAEVVSVPSEDSVVVSVSVSTTELASVATTGVASETITLVVPVVESIVVGVWVGVAVWSPCDIVGTVDLGVMVLKSVNITGLVFLVGPCSVGLSPLWLLNWDVLDSPGLGWLLAGEVSVGWGVGVVHLGTDTCD